MEGFFELFAIAFGRYLFGVIGKYTLFLWQFIFGKSESKKSDWGLDEVIDTNDFKDRVRGMFVVLFLILFAK